MPLYHIILVLGVLLVPSLAGAQGGARLTPLERRIAQRFVERLTPDVQVYLQALVAPQELPDQAFDMAVIPVLARGGEIADADGDNGGMGFLQSITVEVGLRFRPQLVDADLRLAAFVRKKLHQRQHANGHALGLKPAAIKVHVYHADPHFGLMDEFREGLLKLSLALAMVFFIFMVNALPVRSIVNPALGTRKRSAAEQPTTDPSLFALTGCGKEVRLLPTTDYLEYCRSELREPVDPVRGSWYLHSLPTMPDQNLQNMFQRMPFEEAMKMLQGMNHLYKEDVARRLDLKPAIKDRLVR